MNRYYMNGIAAFAAVAIAVMSFASVLNVPSDPAFAAVRVTAPLLA